MEPGQADSTILCHNTDYSLQDMPTAPSVSCVLRDRPVRTKDKTIYVEIDRDCRAVTLEKSCSPSRCRRKRTRGHLPMDLETWCGVLSTAILEFGHPPDHQPHGSSGLAAQTG